MPRWVGPDEGPNILFVEGDLFSSPDPAIAHGVNMRGVMGAGIAKEFRDKFPQMYGTYKALCEHDAVSEMGVLPWKVKDGQYVMNIFSQLEPGPCARLEWIEHGLLVSCEFLISRGIHRMSIPWIGAGIGGIKDRILEKSLRSLMSIYREDEMILTVYDKVVTEERDMAREEIILHKQTISDLSESVERLGRALTEVNGQ